ncbi:MAG: hypothetical protein M1836_003432 [Candelina mexicana]|nr:MAG: hypothetical protein M1836_003432 [Candelina mexicana]
MRLGVQRLVPVEVPVEVPAEVLVEIFSHLQRRDIKAIRQVCKDFQAASSQYLFDRVYVSPQELHLNILTAVSQHPVFSKYVREIVYDCSQFPSELLSRESFEYDHGVLGHPFDEQQMDKLHARYSKHYHQQEKIAEADADFEALTAALQRLSNITIISLIDHWGSCGHIDEYGSNRGLQPSNELGIYKDNLLERPYDVPLARKWGSCYEYPRPISWAGSQKDGTVHAEKGVRGFHTVVRAMSLTKHQVQTFFVDSSTYATDKGIPSTFLRMSPSRLQQTCGIFQYLRRIVLEIQIVSATDLQDGKVSMMLSAAELLGDLRLGVYTHDESFVCAKEILGNKVWTYLRTVDFLSLAIGKNHLVEFCRRHSGTLRNIGFEGATLVDGEWSIAFQILKDMNLQLDNVEAPRCFPFYGYLDPQFYSRKLARYLAGRAQELRLFTDCDDE